LIVSSLSSILISPFQDTLTWYSTFSNFVSIYFFSLLRKIQTVVTIAAISKIKAKPPTPIEMYIVASQFCALVRPLNSKHPS